MLARQIRRLRPGLVLLQHPDDLIFREPCSLHLSVLQEGRTLNPRGGKSQWQVTRRAWPLSLHRRLLESPHAATQPALSFADQMRKETQWPQRDRLRPNPCITVRYSAEEVFL